MVNKTFFRPITKATCFLFFFFMIGAINPFLAQAEIEIEVDPIAFALKGHSFHLIYSAESTRYDLGVFALELPEDSNNEHFTVFFKGSGFKVDYFGSQVDGVFAGIQASATHVDFDYDDPDDDIEEQSAQRVVRNYGVRIGYRFGTDGFYVSPWISVDQNVMEGKDVELAGQTYELKAISFFPTVHVGYQF